MIQWRSRLDRGMRGDLLVVIAAGLLVVAAVAHTVGPGSLRQPEIALAFAVFIAFGECVRLTLPGDRDAAPIGMAAALGYAVLPSWAYAPADYGALQVVAVTAVAMVVGAVPHLVADRAPRLDTVAQRVLVVGFAALLFRAGGLDDRVGAGTGPGAAAVIVGVVAVTTLLDVLLSAALRTGRDRAPFGAVLGDELRTQTRIGSAIAATGALIALAASIMGGWALPVSAVPLVLTQFAFRRYAAIRATYLQTIRALARVTEVGGYTETGHADRVSQLSVRVGRELGMSEAELLRLEYAALMHDIGQLSLTDPIPGGATVMAATPEQQRIATLGATVIRQTGVLDEVATIVERQAEPYRRDHQVDDGSVPVSSRIIRAVNAYDDLVGDSVESAPGLHALERLRLGMAYDYDPRVVESLARVVERSRQ